MPRTAPTQDPVDRIVWRAAGELNANDYNPNFVFTPELLLLERSIMLTGWVQPILIDREERIIDGYHRWRLAQDSEALKRRYHGEVPCAVLDVDRPAAMMLTVRMNRAKGTHAAIRMSAIVHELLDVHGLDPAEVATGIGASREEIALLHQEGVFAALKIPDHQYSRAWYPADARRRPR